MQAQNAQPFPLECTKEKLILKFFGTLQIARGKFRRDWVAG